MPFLCSIQKIILRHGLNTYEIEFGHAYSLADKISMASKVIYSFEAQRKLRHLINDFQPDIAHLHCIYHHQSPAILPVLKSAGIPTVMTAHDLKIACPAYKMLNFSRNMRALQSWQCA